MLFGPKNGPMITVQRKHQCTILISFSFPFSAFSSSFFLFLLSMPYTMVTKHKTLLLSGQSEGVKKGLSSIMGMHTLWQWKGYEV